MMSSNLLRSSSLFCQCNTNMLVNLYFFDAKLFRIWYYKRAHELILFLDAKLFHIW